MNLFFLFVPTPSLTPSFPLPRDHLYLVRSISLSICVFLLGIIHASFLAVSESRRSAYSEIPSYNKPQTFVVC